MVMMRQGTWWLWRWVAAAPVAPHVQGHLHLCKTRRCRRHVGPVLSAKLDVISSPLSCCAAGERPLRVPRHHRPGPGGRQGGWTRAVRGLQLCGFEASAHHFPLASSPSRDQPPGAHPPPNSNSPPARAPAVPVRLRRPSGAQHIQAAGGAGALGRRARRPLLCLRQVRLFRGGVG